MYDDIVILVHEIDDETTEEKEVFATVESVGQNEFFSAAQAGLKAEFKISSISSMLFSLISCLVSKHSTFAETFVLRCCKQLYSGL